MAPSEETFCVRLGYSIQNRQSAITGGSCHIGDSCCDKLFCHDKQISVTTNSDFVVTDIIVVAATASDSLWPCEAYRSQECNALVSKSFSWPQHS